MSFDLESPDHKLELEQVMLQILRELRLQTEILKEAFETEITIGDLDE